MVIWCKTKTYAKCVCIGKYIIYTDIDIDKKKFYNVNTVDDIVSILEKDYLAVCFVNYNNIYVYDGVIADALHSTVTVNIIDDVLWKGLQAINIEPIAFSVHSNRKFTINFTGKLIEFLELMHVENICFKINSVQNSYIIVLFDCNCLHDYDVSFVVNVDNFEKAVNLILNHSGGGSFCINNHVLQVSSNCKAHHLIREYINLCYKNTKKKIELDFIIVEVSSFSQRDANIFSNLLEKDLLKNISDVAFCVQQVANHLINNNINANCSIRNTSHYILEDGETFTANTGVSKNIMTKSNNKKDYVFGESKDTFTDCVISTKIVKDDIISIKYNLGNRNIVYLNKNSNCNLSGSINVKNNKIFMLFKRNEIRTMNNLKLFGLIPYTETVYIVTMAFCVPKICNEV